MRFPALRCTDSRLSIRYAPPLCASCQSGHLHQCHVLNRVRTDATLPFVIAKTPAAHVEPSAALAMNNTAFGFEEPLVTDTPRPFPEQCARIRDRVDAFLDAKDVSDRVKSVQEQTRTALGVIEKALDQYR